MSHKNQTLAVLILQLIAQSWIYFFPNRDSEPKDHASYPIGTSIPEIQASRFVLEANPR